MIASIIVGPSPRRARSTASRVTRIIASRSLPSARTGFTPYAKAFCAKVLVPVCCSAGTEMAQPLLRQRNTVGVL